MILGTFLCRPLQNDLILHCLKNVNHNQANFYFEFIAPDSDSDSDLTVINKVNDLRTSQDS